MNQPSGGPPFGGACRPVFHTRFGMWIDPCRPVVQIPRGSQTLLECDGPYPISIVGAKYGPLCGRTNHTNHCVDHCLNRSAALLLRHLCGKDVFKCVVYVREALFSNPCPDQMPYLVISFTCTYPVTDVVHKNDGSFDPFAAYDSFGVSISHS